MLVTSGTSCRATPPRAELRSEVAWLFAFAGIEARTPPDLRGWLWLHYVVTAAMIAEVVRFGQGAAGVIDSASRSAEAARLAKEMMGVVNARGVDPKVERGESTLGRIPASSPGTSSRPWPTTNRPGGA